MKKPRAPGGLFRFIEKRFCTSGVAQVLFRGHEANTSCTWNTTNEEKLIRAGNEATNRQSKPVPAYHPAVVSDGTAMREYGDAKTACKTGCSRRIAI